MGTADGIELDPALIVEDDTTTQRRLARLLAGLGGGVRHIAAAGSMAEAKARIAAQVPRLALIDIGLPDGSGIELIGWLRNRHPSVPTVVISAWGDEEIVLAALQAGAIGYLLKERDDIELELALQSIQRGGAPIDPFVARRILTLLPAAPSPAAAGPDEHALSERETEILGLVARGYSNREIAELIALSRFTIEGYTKAIYRKLAVSSRTAAVFEAKSRGLLR
ncbi:response regulator transcription factor [Dyella agri]|uniref:Response regulator transcription factor n=1 Tax=Dyella agri TaxID=1926869 RepID=A0ABW8KEB8_9GAMM